MTDHVVRNIAKFYTGDGRHSRNELDEICVRNAFVITLKADARRARALKGGRTDANPKSSRRNDPRSYHDVRFEFTELDHIIRQMLFKIYGSKWRDPARRAQLPFIAAFIDFAGSRYALNAPPLNQVQDLHFHIVVAFPETHVDRAREVLSTLYEDVTAKHTLLFNVWDVEPFDPAKAREGNRDSALANCIEYAMKGAIHLLRTDHWQGEAIRLYPNPNGDTYNYPRPPVGHPDRMVPFEQA